MKTRFILVFLSFASVFLLAACGTDEDWVIPGQPALEPTPTETPQPTTPLVIPTERTGQGATIRGMISYPSEGWCPEMTLYAQNTADGSYIISNWNTGACDYSITVLAPGQYILFAWPVGEYSNLGFMYSDDCSNPKPLDVNPGEILTNIWLDLCGDPSSGNVPRP